MRVLRTTGTLLALFSLAACGEGPDERWANSARGGASVDAHRAGGEGTTIDFIPAVYNEQSRVVLPLTFTDGSRAELVYPPELDLAKLGVFPYGSGRLRGKSPAPARGDVVARDFWIRYGDLEGILVLRNGGRPPVAIARYEGSDGRPVGLWDLDSNDNSHYLGFQFGNWSVLVYDYVAAGAMTESERAA